MMVCLEGVGGILILIVTLVLSASIALFLVDVVYGPGLVIKF